MPLYACRTLAALSILLGATPALADASAPAPASTSPDMLTGEWGGLRTDLRSDGLDVTGSYTSEAAANAAGGAHKDATEAAQLALGVKADMEKLIGLSGGTFQMTLTQRRGHNLSQTAGLDTLLQTQEIYGRGQTVRLTEFWYQQELGGGLDIKLGRLPTGGDFSSFPCNHMNGAYCGAPIGNIGGDFWYNWPVSQWAARLRYQHDNWYVMAGAYEVNPRNLDNDFTIGHFHGATGVLAPAEFGLHARIGRAGLPGLYQVGGWYSSGNADDVLLGADRRPAILATSEPLRRSGRYGGYVLIQQQLTGTATDDPVAGRKTTRGLTAFLTATQTDRDTARLDNQVTGGLRYLGLWASRPQDFVQLSAARTHVNGRASKLDVLKDPGSDSAGSEIEMEADYGAQLLGWLSVQPNVQYIVHPGGYPINDVVVLGVKTSIVL